MLRDSISILISTCDNYSDLWPLFSYYFEKNWQECDLNKYVLTNKSEFPSEDFETIKVGEDKGWSSNMIVALKEIDTEYVLILLDDVFISKKVNNTLFKKICNDFISMRGNYLKFLAHPRSNKRTNSNFFNALPSGTLYRSTAVFALWNRNVLLEILKEGENAWEFESRGSIRSDSYENFFVIKSNFFEYIHSVVRGKFLYSAWKEIKINEPHLIDLIARPINSRIFEFKQTLTVLRHNLFYFLIPLQYRRIIRRVFKSNP